MRRICPLLGSVLAGLCCLHAQTNPPAAHTTVHDPAWDHGATPPDFSRARAEAPSARLTNLSARARAGASSDPLIAGAVVQGSGVLPVVVRAIGPGLGAFGLSTALHDPLLAVFHGGTSLAQTNTHGQAVRAASAYVGAFPLSRAGAGDAGLLGEAGAGTLTAHCSSSTGKAGLALLEFYDAMSTPAAGGSRFANLSARARVEGGENVLILGFTIAGPGELRLLLRGAGGSLAPFGLRDLLADPVIELFAGSTRIAMNDNWNAEPNAAGETVAAANAVGLFALTHSRDAALVATLRAGSYTLVMRGADGGHGVGLAEITEVPRTTFDAAAATNATGLALFRELAPRNRATNLVLSPYSIESALALSYAGAAGQTRREMARVLALPEDNASLQAGFASLRSALEKMAADSRMLAEARSLAGARSEPIEWRAATTAPRRSTAPMPSPEW